MTIIQIYDKVTEIKKSITYHKTKMIEFRRILSRIEESIINDPLKETPQLKGRKTFLKKQCESNENTLKIKLKELKTFLNEHPEI